MKCRKCQFENSADVKFSGDCGTGLEVVRARCNALNSLHFTFCEDCGLNCTSIPGTDRPEDLSLDEKLARIQKYLACKPEEAETMFRDRGIVYWPGTLQEALSRLQSNVLLSRSCFDDN